MYTPDETIRNEAAIRDAALRAMREAYPGIEGLLFPFRVPVAVRIDVYEPLPKSRPKRVTSEPNTFKPDADNIAKLVMDGMNGAVWGDDSQVAEVHVVKWPRRRGIEPHMDIQVYRAGQTQPRRRSRNGDIEMKRKAFKELMRQAVGNVLINTELNAEALERDVDPAVLRGVAYGMAVAPALMDEEPIEFDRDFLAVIIAYGKKCEDIYAENGAVATISKLYGCEVSVDE